MTIINQTPIEELNQLYVYIPGGLVILIVLILGAINIWHAYKHRDLEKYTRLFLSVSSICLAVFIAWSIFANCFLATPSGRYTYEITFTDAESVNEAFEKYEFIEYDNGVYTFEDKTE
jgi:hypothetical protein